MFEIRPNCLYTREDLERELRGIMSLETFLQPLGIRHLYKKAYLGSEILDALEAARQRTFRAAPAAPAARPSGVGRPGCKPAKPDLIPMPEK